jgi:gliding motility-associated-like protein
MKLKIYLFILNFLILCLDLQGQCCVRYNEIDTTVTLINTYYPVKSNIRKSPGDTIIQLLAVPPVDPFGQGYGTIPITAGDLILVVQMQGADIDYSNSSLYGSNNSISGPDNLGGTGYVDLKLVGNYEFVIAKNDVPLTGGDLHICGLTKYYDNVPSSNSSGQSVFQVIRVPRYRDVKLYSNLITAAWNGSAGGVFAMKVDSTIDFNNKRVIASGKGFRGGYQPVRASGTPGVVDHVSNNYLKGSVKGEGIAGTPRFVFDGFNEVDYGSSWKGYPGGDFSRGAPGNAGGGGNIHNAGGGGGGNAGFGGVGGNSVYSNYIAGGRPGSKVALSSDKVFMGGGGGGGDANNALSGVKGGTGGGIILIYAAKTVGIATLESNGTGGQPGNLGGAPDGSGGGGAGGTIVLFCADSTRSLITVSAKGGAGGNSLDGGNIPHGPGGGGGGGYILHNLKISDTLFIADVSKGNNGISPKASSNCKCVSGYGATSGTDGIVKKVDSTFLPKGFFSRPSFRPIAKFTTRNKCLNDSIFFSNKTVVPNSDSTMIDFVSWNFGDSSVNNNSKNPVHKYRKAGSYKVVLIVHAKNGCWDTSTQQLIIYPIPIFAVHVDDSIKCGINKFEFTLDTLYFGVAKLHYWDFGDGSLDSGLKTSHTYLQPDQYIVKILVISQNGCKDSASLNVSYFDRPNSKFSSDKNTSCLNGNLFTFNNESNIKNGSFKSYWTINNNVDSTKNLNYRFKDSGTFKITLFVESNNYCKDTSFKLIRINRNPKSSMDLLLLDSCLRSHELSVMSTVISYNGKYSSYFRLSDSSNYSNVSKMVHRFKKAGTYGISLFVSDDSGCVDSIEKAVRIYDNPTAKIEIDRQSQCLKNNKFEFRSKSVFTQKPKQNYWQVSKTGNLDSGSNFIFVAKDTGKWDVCLICVDEFSCKDTIENFAMVYPQSKVDFVNDSVCYGKDMEFISNSSINSGYITNYSWNFGDGAFGQGKTTFHRYKKPGNYVVYLVTTSNQGCIDTLRKENVACVYPLPTANFEIKKLLDSLNYSYYKLINLTKHNRDLKFQWQFNQTGISDLTNPIIVITDTGIFNVKLSIEDRFGCSDEIVKSFKNYPSNRYFLPSAFTPGGDGKNDVYKIEGLVYVKEFEMQIFSRWGELLFQSNDFKKGWDGYYNNVIVPDGVYIVLVNYLGLDGKWNYLKQTITLLR